MPKVGAIFCLIFLLLTFNLLYGQPAFNQKEK